MLRDDKYGVEMVSRAENSYVCFIGKYMIEKQVDFKKPSTVIRCCILEFIDFANGIRFC